MKNKVNPRELHIGKSNEEKAAYQKFLREEFFLDKTVEEQGDSSKTNTSTFQEKKISENPIHKKSLLLKIKDGDFLNNPWVVTIIGGFIGCVILLYIVQISISQGTLSSRMDNIQKDVDTMKSSNSDLANQFHQLELKLSEAMVGAQKDIDYIKSALHMR